MTQRRGCDLEKWITSANSQPLLRPFDASVPPEAEEVPLPPFEQLRASLDGLSDEDLERFRAQAVPEPGPVMREPLHLENDSRRDVPSTIIACSYSSEVIMQMARQGHPMMAEVATLRDLELVDLPTGHWRMWSRPADLASAIANAAAHWRDTTAEETSAPGTRTAPAGTAQGDRRLRLGCAHPGVGVTPTPGRRGHIWSNSTGRHCP